LLQNKYELQFHNNVSSENFTVEHFTRAASKEFDSRGISVTAVPSGPKETPFFYAYHKSAAAFGGLPILRTLLH